MDSIKDLLNQLPEKNKKIEYHTRGFTQIPNWFLDSKKYNYYEKLVLIIIKRHMIGKKTCFPSIRKISEKVGCCESTTKNAQKKLRESGVLIKIDDNKVRSNVYKINLSRETPP